MVSHHQKQGPESKLWNQDSWWTHRSKGHQRLLIQLNSSGYLNGLGSVTKPSSKLTNCTNHWLVIKKMEKSSWIRSEKIAPKKLSCDIGDDNRTARKEICRKCESYAESSSLRQKLVIHTIIWCEWLYVIHIKNPISGSLPIMIAFRLIRKCIRAID